MIWKGYLLSGHEIWFETDCSILLFHFFIRFLNLLSILWTGLIIKCEFLRRKAVLWSIIKPCLRNGGITVVNRGPALALNRFIENLDNNHFNYKLRIKIFQKFYVDFESVIFIAAGRRKVTTQVWKLNTKTCSVTPTIKMRRTPACNPGVCSWSAGLTD